MRLTHSGRGSASAAAAAVLLAALTSGVEPSQANRPVELGRKEFSRKFDTRRVTHTFSLTSDGPLKRGGRAQLRVSLSTQLTGSGLGQAARAGLIDGYAALVLPPELTSVGAPRLYYVDQASGQDQLLDSTEIPPLKWLKRFKTLGAAPDPARADNAAIFDYFSRVAMALDPTATVFAPAASGLRRGSNAPGLMTAAWMLPMDVHQQWLIKLFDPDADGAAPEIVAKLDVDVTGDPSAAKVKLFAGALSCAAAVVDIPLGMAPPGALPLSELEPRAHAVPKAINPAHPPAPPTLVYSCEWESWEDDIALTPPAVPAMPVVDSRPSVAHEATPGAIDLDKAAAGGAAPGVAAAPVPPDSNPAPGTTPRPAASPSDTPGSTARQVQVGTLPAPGGENEVPLKPITGSAGQRGSQSDSSYPGPAGGGNPLPPPPGFSGGAPGTVRYYGPGGPDNTHGGAQSPPPLAPPGLGSMVLVPAGEFLMGTDAGTPYGDADELPQHKVNLPAFLIDKYPVTNRQFAQFVVGSAYQPEGDWQRYNSPALLDMPVRSVTWNDAYAYAKWAGKRLPNEAEWEKAARGTDGRLYPWGNEWNADILPRGEFSYALVTAPKAASPYGAMAMCGVLWQWTASPWHEYPFDPNARGDKLILRGGAFSNGRNIVRCANRYFEAAGVALNTFTFRCVKDAK